ncbi:MAG TPA: hypothetical protein DCL44_06345 [Elusimicrobia bacterium]|nr:hypothetical protein [Elusimicrobiota bacterium]
MGRKIQTILKKIKTAGTSAMTVWRNSLEELKTNGKAISKVPLVFFSSHPNPQPVKPPPRTVGYIPVVIKTSPDLPPLWGRLVRLCPEGAELISKFVITKGGIIALCFELGGNDYEDIRALVTETVKENSGYFVYRLAFKNPNQINAISGEILKAADVSSTSAVLS